MSAPDSDRFKNEAQKYADQHLRDREENDAIGRLRLALFLGALGPGAAILIHTVGIDAANWMRIGILATMPLAIVVLILNYIRLPGKTKGSPTALMILALTILAVGATYPVARIFSLLPSSPVS